MHAKPLSDDVFYVFLRLACDNEHVTLHWDGRIVVRHVHHLVCALVVHGRKQRGFVQYGELVIQ